mgnify:FL=1|jgi:hypothetical protein
MAEKDLDKKKSSDKAEQGGKDVTLTGQQLITLLVFFPIVVVWLVLAGRIIWSATSNPETLDNIEPLLLALAVLSIPVSGGLAEILKAYASGGDK